MSSTVERFNGAEGGRGGAPLCNGPRFFHDRMAFDICEREVKKDHGHAAFHRAGDGTAVHHPLQAGDR